MKRFFRGPHVSCKMVGVLSMSLSLALAGCSSPGRSPPNSVELTPASYPEAMTKQAPPDTLGTRLAALDEAVTRWQRATDLTQALNAAEEARNLIVGPAGPFYGDANRDGKVSGAVALGILPGSGGEAGIARQTDNRCVVANILGGSWGDPAARWAILEQAIARWTPTRNTFPSLPSHVQRVVGWAMLTLKSKCLADVREYARHARLHVNIATSAADDCDRRSEQFSKPRRASS